MKLRTSKTYYLSTKEIEEITGFKITNSWGEYKIFKDNINVLDDIHMLEDENLNHVLESIKEIVLEKSQTLSKWWEITLRTKSQAPEFHSSNEVEVLISNAHWHLGLTAEDMK